MNLRGTRLARAVATSAVMLAVIAEPLLGTSAAYAATPKAPSYFNRSAVIGRAARWMRKGVPYSQTSWLDDYRTDCSGFVSYAWGLDQSFVTWSLPKVARPIAKEDLLPGDILLNHWKHVVIFGGWTNRKHTAYIGYEQVGGTRRRAVRRVIAYPYDSGSVGLYKPYRYTGGHNLYSPDAKLPAPLIQTYAGGKPLVPSWAKAKNAKRAKVAHDRAIARLNKIHAQQRAEAAKAKAAAERKKAAMRAALRKRLAAKPTEAKETAAPGRTGAKAADRQPQRKQQPAVVQLLHGMLAFISR